MIHGAKRSSKKVSPHTVEDYTYTWKHFPESLTSLFIQQVSGETCREFIDSIERPGTQQHVSILLQTILNAAKKQGIITSNPHSAKVKRNKKVVPIFTTEQLFSLCNQVSATAKPAIVLAAFCGLREGEIMALKKRALT